MFKMRMFVTNVSIKMHNWKHQNFHWLLLFLLILMKLYKNPIVLLDKKQKKYDLVKNSNYPLMTGVSWMTNSRKSALKIISAVSGSPRRPLCEKRQKRFSDSHLWHQINQFTFSPSMSFLPRRANCTRSSIRSLFTCRSYWTAEMIVMVMVLRCWVAYNLNIWRMCNMTWTVQSYLKKLFVFSPSMLSFVLFHLKVSSIAAPSLVLIRFRFCREFVILNTNH